MAATLLGRGDLAASALAQSRGAASSYAVDFGDPGAG